MIDDNKRQENILNLLPEKDVRGLLDELNNGYYSEKSQKMMAHYEDYKNNILSRFAEPTLNDLFLKFNSDFTSLKKVLISQFFRNGPHFMLFPEHKHKTDISDKNDFWNQKFNKLQKLAKKFNTSYKELVSYSHSPDKLDATKFHVKFNEMTGSISYGDKIYNLRKTRGGKNLRFNLFMNLWKKLDKKEGAWPADSLAVQIDLISGAHEFKNKIKIEFYNLIKGINKGLADKGIPVRIFRQGGIKLKILK